MTKKEKAKPKASLKDLIDSVNWVGLKIRGSGNKLPDDVVNIHFTIKTIAAKEDVTNTNSDFVRVRIGKEVLNKLDWNDGDIIFVANHPDDQLTFLFTKIQSKNGYRLTIENGATSGRIQFSWSDKYVPIKASNPSAVEYEIHKKQLIFRANNVVDK